MRELLERLYSALGRGDAEVLSEVLHPEFRSHIAPGMPAGGGEHHGPDAARDDCWWAIGRQFAVRAEPEEWIPCEDGRMLVRGTYRGTRRSDDAAVDSVFMHLWRFRDDQVEELHQVADTARWGVSP